MPEQAQLFADQPAQEPTDELTVQPIHEGPIEWIVEALEPGCREILDTDPDTAEFSEEGKQRMARSMAETLAEHAEHDLMMICMVNEIPPFDRN